MICEDPLVKHFRKEYHISLVKQPNNGINLLDIYEKHDGYLHKVGHIENLFTTSKRVALPTAEKESQMVEMEESKTDKVEKRFALDPLSYFVEAFKGVLKAGFQSAFDNAHFMQYYMKNVRLKRIPILELQEFLSTAKLQKTKNPNLEKDIKAGKYYVIVELIRTNSLSFSAYDKNGKNLDLEASIKPLISGNIDYNSDNSTKEKLSYKGRSYVTFGVVPAKILYNKKNDSYHINIDYKTPTLRDGKTQIEPLDVEEALVDFRG
ncbi:MAG: hypothetical protein AAF518_22340 [Spirochaetota bacterium]